jgi:hypothetical protein
MYQHDCTGCCFLGTIEVQGAVYDAYVCKQDTVIARYGNLPCEYLSGLASIGECPILTTVAKLAVIQGILDPNLSTKRAGAGTIGQEIDNFSDEYKIFDGEKMVPRGCVSCKHVKRIGELPLEQCAGKNKEVTGFCGERFDWKIVSIEPCWYGAYQGSHCQKWEPKNGNGFTKSFT